MAKNKYFFWNLSLFIVLIFTLMIVGVWQVPKIQIRKFNSKFTYIEKLEMENKFRETIIKFISGFFLFTTATTTGYTGWQTYKSSKDSQNTERIAKAIALMSETNELTRIGGILILDKIISDTPKDNDIIFDIICTYIRTHSPIYPSEEGVIEISLREIDYYVKTDVKIALSILVNKRKLSQSQSFFSLNLTNTDLRKTILKNADLRYINFSNSNLSGALLSNSDLRGTHFTHTNLSRSFLENTDLRDATFFHAKLYQTRLDGAKFDGNPFSKEQIESALISESEKQNFK